MERGEGKEENNHGNEFDLYCPCNSKKQICSCDLFLFAKEVSVIH